MAPPHTFSHSKIAKNSKNNVCGHVLFYIKKNRSVWSNFFTARLFIPHLHARQKSARTECCSKLSPTFSADSGSVPDLWAFGPTRTPSPSDAQPEVPVPVGGGISAWPGPSRCSPTAGAASPRSPPPAAARIPAGSRAGSAAAPASARVSGGSATRGREKVLAAGASARNSALRPG